MSAHEISPAATRMAREMIKTIFPARQILDQDAERLVNLTTLVALSDLLDRRLRWRIKPPDRLYLRFRRGKLESGRAGKRDLSISEIPEEEEVNRALDEAEEIFDRYSLDEEERATLFTALPCLGLYALSDYTEWIREPPFTELGGPGS